jgi:homotetrameric cytidine deaminase
MNAHKSDSNLYQQALDAREKAHAPYSHYRVGVLLETTLGEIVTGCNVECVDYLGLEAAEVALARLVTQQDWRADPESIKISRAIFAVPRIDRQSNLFMPSPQSLGRLRFFSTYDVPLLFVDEQGEEEGYMLERLLPLCPNIDDQRQLFLQRNLDTSLTVENLANALNDKDIAGHLLNLQKHCIAPASDYCVTCVIKSENGQLYRGCNIETSMHDAIHAEETAIANMVAGEGEDAKISEVYVLVAGKTPAWPCGNCRQKLLEFSDKNTSVIVVDQNLNRYTESLHDLLPHGFKADDMA